MNPAREPIQSKGKILLGICGGIAAYKIPHLVSLLVQQGYQVRVLLSQAGARFASAQALEVLSGQQVYNNLSQDYQALPSQRSPSPVLHVALVEEADIFLLAPASYNWLGKAANGIADDLLSTLFAAWPLQGPPKKPLLFAPAMNPEMWHKPVLQENIARLEQQGCLLIEPGSGFLACRAEGQGRMAEPEELYFRLESQLRFRCAGTTVLGEKHGLHGDNAQQQQNLPSTLAGKKILLTAGSTREALDPVRYISNRSSGRSAVALACAARDLGAEVTMISSMVQTQSQPQASLSQTRLQGSCLLLQKLFHIRILSCNSAAEMAQHAADAFPYCDWALATAAVCDFRPAQLHGEKIKKEEDQQSYQLELAPNPNILAYWGQNKKPRQKVLGFALECASGPDAISQEQNYALAKLQRKNADAIVLNRLGNLEGNNAQAEVFFVEDFTEASPPQSQNNTGHILELQQKRDFAAKLLLLLAQRWL